MKVRKFEIVQNKMGLKGCTWSSLNAPGTGSPPSHSVFEWENSPFSQLALCGNKKWPPSINMKQIENCRNKMGLKGANGPLQCPRHLNPSVSFSSGFKGIPLSHGGVTRKEYVLNICQKIFSFLCHHVIIHKTSII